jgi:thymidylate synthase (FAD)
MTITKRPLPDVKLISVTAAMSDDFPELGHAENIILYCARVSSDQSNQGTGLIKYLIGNQHWSPFELAHMTVEINTSRVIAQQILRHKSFAFQEFSQRYAKVEGTVKYEARRQHEKSRQSSVDDLPDKIKDWFKAAQEEIEERAFSLYDDALNFGIAKECARFLLPGSAKTKLYMCGSVRSWIHYFDLRCDRHTH